MELSGPVEFEGIECVDGPQLDHGMGGTSQLAVTRDVRNPAAATALSDDINVTVSSWLYDINDAIE